MTADHPWGVDKVLHASFSFVVTLSIYAGTTNLAYAGGVALLLGIAKEVRDETHGGRWSWWDFAWDGLGIAGVSLVVLLVRLFFQ